MNDHNIVGHGIERTATLLDRSRGGILGSLRRLRSFRGRCGGFAREVESELLAAVPDGAELMLEGGCRAVSVKRGHELVRLGAQGGALGVHDCQNTEGLRLGLFLWRHDARGVVCAVM